MDVDADVVLIDAGQVGADDVGVLALFDIQRQAIAARLELAAAAKSIAQQIVHQTKVGVTRANHHFHVSFGIQREPFTGYALCVGKNVAQRKNDE